MVGVKTPVDAVLVTNATIFGVHRRRIIDLAATHKLPMVVPGPLWVQSGALASYGTNWRVFAGGAATYVDRLLKGAKPADLPIEQSARFEFVINLKSAHALGIKSPLDAYFSIGLGFATVNPLEMARAYATFANGGRRVDGSLFGDRPRVVETVERIRSGEVEENVPEPKQVLKPGQAEVLTDILEGVVRSGTGTRAAVSGCNPKRLASSQTPAGPGTSVRWTSPTSSPTPS